MIQLTTGKIIINRLHFGRGNTRAITGYLVKHVEVMHSYRDSRLDDHRRWCAGSEARTIVGIQRIPRRAGPTVRPAAAHRRLSARLVQAESHRVSSRRGSSFQPCLVVAVRGPHSGPYNVNQSVCRSGPHSGPYNPSVCRRVRCADRSAVVRKMTETHPLLCHVEHASLSLILTHPEPALQAIQVGSTQTGLTYEAQIHNETGTSAVNVRRLCPASETDSFAMPRYSDSGTTSPTVVALNQYAYQFFSAGCPARSPGD